MDVNVQKQCVKVFTAEGVINMQPLLVLTQDLSGVAQQDTLVQGIGDIRDDISTLAKQGTNPDATLSLTQTAAQGAALNSQIARGYIGTPQSGQADTLFGAIANITIDTSTIAKQGTNASATLTATQTAATNAYASAEAAKIGVVDGNDTAVGVAKEVRGEVGTGSDTAAETGTLFAVVKWVKDKVKSIFQLIGSPASGQPSTLFAAIAAGGGGGSSAAVPEISVADTGSAATQELAANTLYIFPNRTSNLTLTLGAPVTGEASEYHFIVEVGSTLPTITMPTGLTWKSSETIAFDIDTTYEVSILDNYAIFVVW